MTDIHSCSYYCDKPQCIKAQRDELRERLAIIKSYPAKDNPPQSPQRTWVGLDYQDKSKFSSWLDHKTDDEVFTAIDDLLRKMNT
jgi:hypothetical protein